MGHMFKSLMKAPGNGTKRSHGTSTFEALFRHISPLSSSLFVCLFVFFSIPPSIHIWSCDSGVADDVSLLVVLLDTNPFFWSTASLPFSKFLSHVTPRPFTDTLQTLNFCLVYEKSVGYEKETWNLATANI